MVQEKELIAGLQSEQEKEKAFRELVSRYKERLYWQIRSMVFNHDDADDVLQNTFIKVYRNIGSFRGDSKLHTWMYRIAANESITFLNRKARRNNISIEELKDRTISGLESDVYFEGDAFQLLFQKAIASLPEQQRLIFTSKYFSDHTFKELSEIMDITESGLKSSYHIAVKKIKEFIKSSDETVL